MFDEGGLEQDGGSVDPVSGNEVPIGSSKEEVRDDIDAKLSEGEFVFPADVVRFIGLNNLMQIRQEAKAGLKKMEAMGQMGNSEEATMPDDIPFNSEDIMVEDDDGNEGELEMNTGGVVYQPSQVGSQFNIAPQQQQMYQPPQIYQQPMQQTGYGPSFASQPQQPQQYTGFQSLIPMPTQKYENVSYINKTTGETMVIPHVGGKPVFEPPEGFTKIKAGEEAPKEEAKIDETLNTSVPTATVTQPKDDPDRMLVGDKFLTREQREKIEDQENMNKSYDAMVKQMMDNNPGIGMDEIKDKIKAGEGTIKVFGREIKAPGFLFTEDKINEAVDKAYTGSVIDSPPILKRVDGKLVVSDTGEVQIAEDEKPQSTVGTIIQSGSAKSLNMTDEENKAVSDASKKYQAKLKADAMAEDIKAKAAMQKASDEADRRQQEKEDRYNKDTSNFGASDSFKQGGIASKTKKKTMKQGGLASKK